MGAIQKSKFSTHKQASDKHALDLLNSLNKNLPANIDAERSVLGAILLNDELIHTASTLLRADDFYNQAHRIIFQSMLDIVQEGKRVDLVTLQISLLFRAL